MYVGREAELIVEHPPEWRSTKKAWPKVGARGRITGIIQCSRYTGKKVYNIRWYSTNNFWEKLPAEIHIHGMADKEEEKKNRPAKKQVTKRSPTPYNKFVSLVFKELHTSGFPGRSEAMAIVSKRWDYLKSGVTSGDETSITIWQTLEAKD